MIEESIVAALEERLMYVHTAAINAVNRLGHEGSVNTVSLGDFFYDVAVGHDIVGHVQGIGISHIDFVLAAGDLMMRFIDGDTHAFQGSDCIATQVVSGIRRGHIEISGIIQWFAADRVFEIEIFQFRSHVVNKAHIGGFFKVAAQDITRDRRRRVYPRVYRYRRTCGRLRNDRPATRVTTGKYRGRAWRPYRFHRCG